MKLRNILQLAGLVAVICGCSTQQPIAAPASATGYRQGPVSVNVGDELRLRYRVVLHLGDERDAHIADLFREYTAE